MSEEIIKALLEEDPDILYQTTNRWDTAIHIDYLSAGMAVLKPC